MKDLYRPGDWVRISSDGDFSELRPYIVGEVSEIRDKLWVRVYLDLPCTHIYEVMEIAESSQVRLWRKKEWTLLHLGCGLDYRPGFINSDPRTDGWRFQDGLPYPDESIMGITISHALYCCPVECLDLFFEESFRVLQPGGVLRVTDDETQDPMGPRYQAWHHGATWLTGTLPVMAKIYACGLTPYAKEAMETTFPTAALCIAHREHKRPKYVFYVEGVKL